MVLRSVVVVSWPCAVISFLQVRRARFGQPEVQLGVIPGFGGTQRLVTRVGRQRAMELMMTGGL